MTGIRRKILLDLVETRLGLLPGVPDVTVFVGEVPDKPPVLTTPAGPDASGRVAPYVALFGFTGNPVIEADVGDCNTELDWPFQVTCAAAYEADCLHLVDRVYDQLYRWTPVLAGHSFGRVKPPPGFDPGPARPDTQVKPIRFFVPLQWRLPVTTS